MWTLTGTPTSSTLINVLFLLDMFIYFDELTDGSKDQGPCFGDDNDEMMQM